MPELPDGVTPVEFFRLNLENAQPEDLMASHITFYVTQEVMAANQFHKWGILLHRYNETTGKWETLETTRIAEDSAKVYYSAVVPGFSLFAISGTKTATPVRFAVSNLQVLGQVFSGQTATISADIKNVSTEDRSYNAVLYLDNAVEAVQTLQIGAGKSLKVTFSGVKASQGQHSVRLENQTTSYTVSAQPAPTATPTPTATRPAPTATSPAPTPTPTATKPAATATAPAPTATPTATRPAPTATSPAATPTPTATVVSPTPTPTATPTPPVEDEGGISAGTVIIIVLIVVGVAAAAYGGYIMYRRRQSGLTGP